MAIGTTAQREKSTGAGDCCLWFSKSSEFPPHLIFPHQTLLHTWHEFVGNSIDAGPENTQIVSSHSRFTRLYLVEDK
uniref:Uncharacterized protein n=1 Tax=Setaria viridis TaxID=4556 RepID=A0A4U6W7W2_SETVI|nr:hypothetical protein SEVIR_1G012650v2 [Setaria viridis]